MDCFDQLKDSMRHFSDVPINFKGKKCKNKNSTQSGSDASPGEGNELAISNRKLLEEKLKLAESNNANGKAKARGFATYDDLFNGEIPCTLFYLDRNSSRLKSLKTFDELSKYIETADENLTPEGKIIEMLQSASVGQIAHFRTLGKYLRYLYKEDRLMDVHIDVHGTSFMAHRIVLCCHSGYFKNLLINDRKSVKIPIQVKVFGVSVEAFAAFIQYIYTGRTNIHQGIVSDFIYIAEYLDVKSLRHKLFSIADNLTLEEAIKILLKPCDPSRKTYCTALSKVISQFSVASMIPDFLDLNVGIFCNILKSDALQVAREYEVFQVAVRWIVHGGRDRIPFITRVMNNIRFCHMTVEELFDCLEETSLFLDHTDLRDLILIANWVLTAMQLNKADPFNFIVPPRRTSYSHRQQDRNRGKYNPFHQCMKEKRNFSVQNSLGSMSSASHSSKSSTKQSIFKSSNEDCTTVEKSRSSCYEKPIDVQSDTIAPETDNVQTLSSSSAERLQVTSLTQTSSTKSCQNRSPALEQNTLLLQDTIPATKPRMMISPEAEENVSNHSSPRYAKPLMLPPKEDMVEAHSTAEPSEIQEVIVQRVIMSPAPHGKQTNWCSVSSKESLSNCEAQARPMVLQPGECQNYDFPNVQNIIHTLELSPQSHEKDIQKPKSINCSKMFPASHLKPTDLSPEPIKESTRKNIHTQPSNHPVKYAKPIVLPPHISPVKTKWMPMKKCECATTISPAGQSNT